MGEGAWNKGLGRWVLGVCGSPGRAAAQRLSATRQLQLGMNRGDEQLRETQGNTQVSSP